jgi:hypothetical protein
MKHWTWLIPAILAAVIYYAYSTTGFVGGLVRSVVDPIVQPVFEFARHLFHV